MKKVWVISLSLSLILPQLFISANGAYSTLRYMLTIDGSEFQIPWHMETGKVSHIEVDKQSSGLTISLDRFQMREDNLLIKLPSKLIFGGNGGSEFSVMVNYNEVAYKKTWEGDQVIELTIPLSTDATKVQIFPTHAAAELPIALLAYGSEISLIVFVLGRYGRSLHLIRQE